MARFEPFRGVRYAAADDAEALSAPPYDVVDEAERDTLVAGAAHNVAVVDLPRGDDPYATAGATFRGWLDDGVLVRDDPSLYVYRMSFVDGAGQARHTTGVLGALELAAPGEGGILPHELTTPKAKSDRLDLQRATAANLSPVWGLSPAAGLTALLATEGEPLVDFTADDGVQHTLWAVSDAGRVDEITRAVSSAPIVIADGHHRYETALTYQAERRAVDGPGPWDSMLTLVVELVDAELSVGPIHRLLTGLPEDTDLAALLDRWFQVTPAGPVDAGIAPTMVSQGFLVLVESHANHLLTPRPGAFDHVRDLDTVRLDVALADLPTHDVHYQHGVEHVVDAVARGDAQAGVLLRPATVRQIVAIAEGGERMPPKTTFFYPKPRTGLVFRTLD